MPLRNCRRTVRRRGRVSDGSSILDGLPVCVRDLGGVMRAAVLVFPGTWSDGDCLYALSRVGIEGRRVWHRESPTFERDELVVLPGGFSYGDYLRCGAIA